MSTRRFALEIWTLFLRTVWLCFWRPGGLTVFFLTYCHFFALFRGQFVSPSCGHTHDVKDRVQNHNNNATADPLLVGAGAQHSVRSCPLCWTWLVKLRVSQSLCTERYWSKLLQCLGDVPYTTVAASSRSLSLCLSGHKPMQYHEASSGPAVHVWQQAHGRT